MNDSSPRVFRVVLSIGRKSISFSYTVGLIHRGRTQLIFDDAKTAESSSDGTVQCLFGSLGSWSTWQECPYLRCQENFVQTKTSRNFRCKAPFSTILAPFENSRRDQSNGAPLVTYDHMQSMYINCFSGYSSLTHLAGVVGFSSLPPAM